MSTAARQPLRDPRAAGVFRFVRCGYVDGTAELVYAFDDGPELVERIRFPGALTVPDDRRPALEAALNLLHLVAGVSYYKAGVPPAIAVETTAPDAEGADLLDALYFNGLAEFAYRNQLDLRGRIAFPRVVSVAGSGSRANPARDDERAVHPGLPQRVLVPIGGGKDSLVVVEALKRMDADTTATWVGSSSLIATVAGRTGLPMLNIGRELSPVLFEYNRMGAWNGHVPVTAINSAILVCAALIHGFNAVAFANERSASAATLEFNGLEVNHQWSKGWAFEQQFSRYLQTHVAPGVDWFSLLRPFSELAVARAFARSGAAYFDVFSSCNRNFRIFGPKPSDRWCGQCPKCRFVFLALAPFLPKPRLVATFGRNLLDDDTQAAGFDALIEYHDHKPFECVGEAAEARAAFAALAARPEWREDALVARFRDEIAPQLDAGSLALEPWLAATSVHAVPARFSRALEWIAA